VSVRGNVQVCFRIGRGASRSLEGSSKPFLLSSFPPSFLAVFSLSFAETMVTLRDPYGPEQVRLILGASELDAATSTHPRPPLLGLVPGAHVVLFQVSTVKHGQYWQGKLGLGVDIPGRKSLARKTAMALVFDACFHGFACRQTCI